MIHSEIQEEEEPVSEVVKKKNAFTVYQEDEGW